MRKYNCSDPEENQLPYWMMQTQVTPPGTNEPAQNNEERQEEAVLQTPEQSDGGPPPFVYQCSPFFPSFCVIKQK